MKRKKLGKFWTAVLTVFAAAVFFAVPAWAAETGADPAFEMDGSTLVKYSGSATHVQIPDGVTAIGDTRR